MSGSERDKVMHRPSPAELERLLQHWREDLDVATTIVAILEGVLGTLSPEERQRRRAALDRALASALRHGRRRRQPKRP